MHRMAAPVKLPLGGTLLPLPQLLRLQMHCMLPCGQKEKHRNQKQRHNPEDNRQVRPKRKRNMPTCTQPRALTRLGPPVASSNRAADGQLTLESRVQRKRLGERNALGFGCHRAAAGNLRWKLLCRTPQRAKPHLACPTKQGGMWLQPGNRATT